MGPPPCARSNRLGGLRFYLSPLRKLSIVMAGLDPAIPIRDARPCHPKRDARVKPAHDKWGQPPRPVVGLRSGEAG
jgi:hypothetical protein